MPYYAGDYEETAMVTLLFNTNDANGAGVDFTGTAGNIVIIKDASATYSGVDAITLTKNLGGADNGRHRVQIDTSNETGNTGYWTPAAGGSFYEVALNDAVVSTQSVSPFIGSFTLEMSAAYRYMVDTLAANIAAVATATNQVKTKTDSLTFTQAGQVDSNVQYVNDVAVGGTGASGDEWGPA